MQLVTLADGRARSSIWQGSRAGYNVGWSARYEGKEARPVIARTAAMVRRYSLRGTTVQERNIRNLVIQTAFAGAVSGGIGTFITVYVARLGASAVIVSLLTSIPALVTIVVALPAGAIVARQRKPVRDSARAFYAVRLCYLLVALAALLPAGLAWWAVVVIWGLSAVPGALANTAWYGVFAEAIPANRRAAVNGGRWALLGLVTALSVAIFGQLLDRIPFPLDYQLVFVVSFAAGIASTLYYSRLIVPDHTPVTATPASNPPAERLLQTLRPLAEGGPFLRFCVGTTVLRLGLFLAAGLYSVYWVRDLHATDGIIGLRTTVGNAALVVGYPLWGWLATKLGHERALIFATIGLGMYPVATGLVGPGASLFWLLPAALIWGLFAGGIDVTLFEGLLRSAPADRRAQFVAINTLLANLVAFFGPILGATLAGWISIPPVLFAAGALHFIAAATIWWMARQRGER
jgi:MFS family permease